MDNRQDTSAAPLPENNAQTRTTHHEQDLAALQEAILAQQELISSAYATQQAASGQLLLKSMLLQIVQVFGKLTDSPEGSVFLLDENGTVIESVLARGATMRTLKRNLIGQVLDKGLAGWVVKHQRLGIIDDTKTDDRWLTLPYEPYTVRSVLCVPLFKRHNLIGVVTLMHPEPQHFRHLRVVKFVPMVAQAVALVLDNLCLHIELTEATSAKPLEAPEPGATLTAIPATNAPSSQDTQAQTGVYIITAGGKFLYANSRFAEIFEYSFEELVTLNSLFDLVNADERSHLEAHFDRCLSGKIRNFSSTFQGISKYGDSLTLALEGNQTRFYGKPAAIGTVRRQDTDSTSA